jgi:hypothetical protein
LKYGGAATAAALNSIVGAKLMLGTGAFSDVVVLCNLCAAPSHYFELANFPAFDGGLPGLVRSDCTPKCQDERKTIRFYPEE